MTQETSQMDVCGLTDAELLSGLKRLVGADRALSVKMLLHLGEVDARGLCLKQAYPSTHEYAVKALKMSDAEAYLRINAARLSRRFPRVLELFGLGELHLTSIKFIGPLLAADNHMAVLARARGKTKREIELLVAELAPRPDVPASIRKLPCARGRRATTATRDRLHGASAQTALMPSAEAPAARVPTALMQTPEAPFVPDPATGDDQASIRSTAAAAAPTTFVLEAPRPRASCTALSPGKFTLKLTLDQAAYDKLQQLRELLRHQVPNGDLAVLVERALDVLHDKTLKQRFAQTKPKAQKKSGAVKRTLGSRKVRSRHIPRAVVREVFTRDGGQCRYVSAEGKRCEAHGFMEKHHHDVPFARGGASTVENVRLMCHAHNALLAEQDYGRDFIRAKKQCDTENNSSSLG